MERGLCEGKHNLIFIVWDLQSFPRAGRIVSIPGGHWCPGCMEGAGDNGNSELEGTWMLEV